MRALPGPQCQAEEGPSLRVPRGRGGAGATAERAGWVQLALAGFLPPWPGGRGAAGLLPGSPASSQHVVKRGHLRLPLGFMCTLIACGVGGNGFIIRQRSWRSMGRLLEA